eukprot:scaffold227089_cov16-Prasinocladus_malaysianus.AAC.1
MTSVDRSTWNASVHCIESAAAIATNRGHGFARGRYTCFDHLIPPTELDASMRNSWQAQRLIGSICSGHFEWTGQPMVSS